MTAKKPKSTKIVAIALVLSFLMNTSLAIASEITSKKMVELTNKSRTEAGLESLTTNDKLEQAAKAKADDMFYKQYFEHTSPEGLTPWYWFNVVGYEYVFAAENLAIDFITAEGAHSALMKSTGHRENILGASYKEIGIAVVSGEFEGRDSIIIVEEFGSQREHRITVNNAPFFEEPEEEKVEIKVVPKTVKSEAPRVVTKPLSKEPEVQVDKTTEQVDIPQEAMKVELEAVEVKDNSKIEPKIYGKVIPKIYSVRSVRELKKVYTEDIYWRQVEDKDIVESINSNVLKIRMLIRDLTNGVLSVLV